MREPLLTLVQITELRPTQITMGLREVQLIRKRWGGRAERKNAISIGRHMIPVVLGPKKQHFIIDHHHLCRALLDEHQKKVMVTVVARLDDLDKDQFWFVLDNRGWMHPYDEKGQRRPNKEIPKSVADLIDDPLRSLAGELRRAGGFAKDTTPFSEFLWAQFLRQRISAKEIERDFCGALAKALELAKSRAAGYLPGWCGPITDD